MSCWEMLVEKWIYKCVNLWCILDVFLKRGMGKNVQRCWRDVDVEGGVAHRDSLCQWDVKPGGMMGWERCTRSWWRHCSGNLVFVLGGCGYCHLSSLSTWQQRDKNVVERVGDGCRARGQCHRVCSERVCLSRVSEKRRKEGVGLGVCLIKCTLFICGGSMSRVSAHARSLQLLISTLSLLSHLTGCNNKITNECS